MSPSSFQDYCLLKPFVNNVNHLIEGDVNKFPLTSSNAIFFSAIIRLLLPFSAIIDLQSRQINGFFCFLVVM